MTPTSNLYALQDVQLSNSAGVNLAAFVKLHDVTIMVIALVDNLTYRMTNADQ